MWCWPDRCPEATELVWEVYNLHFPYAECSARKKQLLINTLVFEQNNTTIYDEFGDEPRSTSTSPRTA